MDVGREEPTDAAETVGDVRPPSSPLPATHPRGLWFRIFRVGGIAVYVDPLVVGLLALVFLGDAGPVDLGSRLGVLGILLASVFLHEMGHAWMARRRGLRVGGIYLHLIPFAYVERGRPQDELRVALAGPATNLLIAGALCLIPGLLAGFPWTRPAHWLETLPRAALAINLLMGFVNLVPALPADGGRALRAALLMKMAPATAYARTARVGTFVGAAALAVAGGVRRWPESGLLAVTGAFLIIVAWREARAGQIERRLERRRERAG
jgi:Zn-dependent protease